MALTQTNAQVQINHNAIEAAKLGLDSTSDLTDTQATAALKSGVHALGASTTDAPTTNRSVMLTMARDADAVGELRHAQVVIDENQGLYFVIDDGGTLGSWKQVQVRGEAGAFATGTTIGTLTLGNGSITDSSGTISFANENLNTTGTVKVAAGAVAATDTSGTPGVAISTTDQVIKHSAASTGFFMNAYDYTSGTTFFQDLRAAGSTVGSVSYNGSLVSYNTSSDPRLKSEFRPITGALDKVIEACSTLMLGEFEYLGSGATHWGYNAHKLVDLQPNTGGVEGKGSRDEELGGEVTPASADYSKRVPLLEAAIYELLQRVEALET